MDMMNSIASLSMSMASERFATQYSLALTKKAMETQELAAQELLQMLPQQQPMPVEGRLIDVYA